MRRCAALADSDARLSADERAFGRDGWPQLLERSDLVLCPNRSGDVLAAVSAVAAEAIANGIPVVVPADTEVATLLSQCGGGGTLFDRFEPDAIVEATGRALDDFDRFATLAYEGVRCDGRKPAVRQRLWTRCWRRLAFELRRAVDPRRAAGGLITFRWIARMLGDLQG